MTWTADVLRTAYIGAHMIVVGAGLIFVLFGGLSLRRLRAVGYVFGIQSLIQMACGLVVSGLLVLKDMDSCAARVGRRVASDCDGGS